MRTPAQIEASRRNGARSRGPKTAEGKARSSRNATTHGLTTKFSAMDPEELAAYRSFLAAGIARFQPASESELVLVEQFAVANWLQHRAWALETDTFNRQINAPGQDPRIAGTFAAIGATPSKERELACL
ncbi:MAG: hypothetical protein NTY38_17400, partial [Acidobacteria bacterium]|nr:hypothetical protein [Acidobacteriota bacterium]